MCYSEGFIQAYLDGELDRERQQEMACHLEQCAECKHKLEILQSNGAFVSEKLEVILAGSPEQRNHDKTSLITKSKPDEEKIKKGRVKIFMSRYNKVITAAALVIVLLTTFSFADVRSAASEFLTIFRVEKVQTISINSSDLKQLETAIRNGAGNVTVDNFGIVTVNGKQETVPVTMAEAQNSVDFEIKLPQPEGYNEPELHKVTGNSMYFTLDVHNINNLLQNLGGTQLLPENLNGKTFSLHIPTAIVAKYNSGKDTIMVAQARSPELKVPSGTNVLAIRDALLGIPMLPDSIRNQLLAVTDWQHTVLIPNVDGTSREVTVNGTRGVFIDNSGKANENTLKSLIWQQNNVVYLISGDIQDLDSALAIATQMK